jgi:WD40 repeat protein
MDDRVGDASVFDERLDELATAYLKAQEAGLAPDRQTWLELYPELAAELREFFADHDRLDRLAAPLRSIAVLSNPGLSDYPDDFPTPPRTFGDFTILGALGQGGMGVVWRARQARPDRLVALKMFRAGELASPTDIQRFRNEAEVIAGLEHPHILPVYEVGEQDGVLHFTMKLAEGGSLAQHLDRFRSEPRAAARLLATVAQAVHYAHQRGILHRDLKPSNILLDAKGEPYVSDFGLAKRLEGDSHLTQTGAIIGTPGYMAPEQATGGKAAISTATDVYGLGAIRFALLTGQPPFRGDSVLTTLDLVRTREPDAPSSRNRRVDRDLDTICLKCLEKEPKQRYQSANAVADDLERWLAGETIRARHVRQPARLWRWCRRNRAVSGLLAALVASTVGVLVLLTAGLVVITRQRNQARERERLERPLLYAADMRLAYERFVYGEADQLPSLLARHEPVPGEEDQRSFEWYYLRSLADALPRERVCYRGHSGEVMCAIFAPNGRDVVSGDGTGAIHSWDATTGVCRAILRGHLLDVNGLHFSPDGRTLASGGKDATVRLWDWALGKEKARLLGVDSEVEGVCFSPDGRRLVAPGANGMVCVWDVNTRTLQLRLQPCAERVYTAVFSPDGRRIAAVGRDHHLRIWDAKDGQTLIDNGVSGAIYDVCYSLDGTRLVTGDETSALRLWDAANGGFLQSVRVHPGLVRAVSFAPDGSSVASGGDDQALRVWHPWEGILLTRGHAHSGTVTAVAYTPNENVLVTGSRDHTVRVWDLPAVTSCRVVPVPHQNKTRAAFSPDGRFLATWAPGSELIIWDRFTLEKLASLRLSPNQGHLLAFAPDGRSLALSEEDEDLAIYSLEPDRGAICLRRSASHRVSFHGNDAMTFTPEGSLLVFEEHASRLTNFGSDEAAYWPLTVRALVPCPDGRTLAVGVGDSVRFWDRSRQAWQAELYRLTSDSRSVVYSPDGRLVAAASADGRIVLINPTSHEVRAFLPSH